MAKTLIFMLHGYGGSEESMLGITPLLKEHVPSESEMICLRGSIDARKEDGGYAWFPLDWYFPHIPMDSLPAHILERFESELPQYTDALEKLILETVEKKNADISNTFLFGFSQGAMMSLAIGSKMSLGGVIAYAGLYTNVSRTSPYKTQNVFLLHGKNDDVVPFSCMPKTKEELESRDVKNVSTYIDPIGMHLIDMKSIKPIGDFISNKGNSN